MRPRNLLIFAVVVLITGLGLRAYRAVHRRPAEEIFLAAGSAPIWSRVAEVREVVARVANGERLWCLDRRRGWARVRTDAGQEGWIEERFLVGRDIYDQFERLQREAASRPPQAFGQIRVLANLRTEPGRNAPRLYQFRRGEELEILARAVAERAPENTTREPGATESQNAAGEPRREDWYLVRRRAEPRRTGWLLARFVDLNAPEEIEELLNEKRIVSAFDLGAVRAEDEKPAYLVAFTERAEGLPYDFNGIRVFTWHQSRARYETAYVETGFMAFWPIEVKQEGEQRAFSFAVDENGERRMREYRMQDVVVRRVLPKAAMAVAKR